MERKNRGLVWGMYQTGGRERQGDFVKFFTSADIGSSGPVWGVLVELGRAWPTQSRAAI